MYYEISVLHAYIFPFTGLHYKALFFIFKYLALHLVSFLCLFIIRFMDCICDCGTKAIRLISHTAFLKRRYSLSTKTTLWRKLPRER